MSPAQWRCNCSGHSGPHLCAYVERAVTEANLDDDHQAASFATDPCHGLFCKQASMEAGDKEAQQPRVTKSHSSFRDKLARVLQRVKGTSDCLSNRGC
jgi:hypothetical protein